MSPWILLVVLGAVSLSLRSVVVLTAGLVSIPPRLLAWCALLGPAIVAALLGGSIATSLAGARPLAELAPLAVGAAVAVRSGSAGGALGAGLAVHAVVLVASGA